MSKRLVKVFCSLVAATVTGVASFAQDGAYSSYSPYSVFGFGNIAKQGTAYSRSMGGVGLASRNHRFINYLNPAAVTARDTLSFMADVGLSSENRMFAQGDVTSANNTLNIADIAASFPIYKSSAMFIGLTPYSDVGYDFSKDITDQDVIGRTGNITYTSYGSGGLYQLFAGYGATFWKRLSIGAEAIYYFGNIDRTTKMVFSGSDYRSLYSGYTYEINAFTGKFGFQYEQPLPNDIYLTLAATYKPSAKVNGRTTSFKYASVSSVVDTLSRNVDTLSHSSAVSMSDEIGVGISLRKGDKWFAEFDYLRSSWSNTGIDGSKGFLSSASSKFSATDSQSYRIGFEYIPNRNDIRYYMRRCSYRVGAYYDKEYYKFDGNNVAAQGVTFGMTFPVNRWYNGISVAVDLGQRGSLTGNMTRERYVSFSIGFNIHDLWFRKIQYD